MSKLAEIVQRLRKWVSKKGPAQPVVPDESPVLRQKREPLFRCAMQILDDAAGAEQVIRQALREAERGVLAPNGPAPPKHDEWLLRQVVSLSVQRLKALSIVPVVPPLPDAARGGSESESDGADPSATQGRSTSEQQRRERLSRALLKLPVEMRVTLILARMQKRPLTEVATLLGTTETTCLFWLSHGRKQLRRALQRDLAPGPENGGPLRILVSPETPHDVRGNKKAIARA